MWFTVFMENTVNTLSVSRLTGSQEIMQRKYFCIFCWNLYKRFFFRYKYVSDDSIVKMDIWGPDVASNRLKIDHCIAIYYQSFGLVWTDRFCNDRYYFVCQSKTLQEIGCQAGFFIQLDIHG